MTATPGTTETLAVQYFDGDGYADCHWVRLPGGGNSWRMSDYSPLPLNFTTSETVIDDHIRILQELKDHLNSESA